jgi:hypothetical protein
MESEFSQLFGDLSPQTLEVAGLMFPSMKGDFSYAT